MLSYEKNSSYIFVYINYLNSYSCSIIVILYSFCVFVKWSNKIKNIADTTDMDLKQGPITQLRITLISNIENNVREILEYWSFICKYITKMFSRQKHLS